MIDRLHENKEEKKTPTYYEIVENNQKLDLNLKDNKLSNIKQEKKTTTTTSKIKYVKVEHNKRNKYAYK